MSHKSIALALASVAAATANLLPPAGGERLSSISAFAATPSTALRVPENCAAARSAFINALVRAPVADTSALSQHAVTMMAGRRNLKTEKRKRNELYARQFRKSEAPPRFARGPSGARTEEEQEDGKWLEQIYGQHSIYRRDTVAVKQDGSADGIGEPSGNEGFSDCVRGGICVHKRGFGNLIAFLCV